MSMRTKELCNKIAALGHDPEMASHTAVAVEATSAGDSFQSLFEEQVSKDPEMASSFQGITATIATLSHSHYTCMCRNILAGKRGCSCVNAVVTAADEKPCTCAAKPFLDEEGNYSLAHLKQFDQVWANKVETGLSWEILDARMNTEEPDAALTISVALNKCNEVAMQTAHTEIMHTLVRLCKPDPTSNVTRFEPVRDRMVELYGSAVDHPDFHHAFRVVMDAGGHDSPHMQDLHAFTSVHVNPRKRKLKFEVYAVVAMLSVQIMEQATGRPFMQEVLDCSFDP